ncbi:MAG: glycoside hydrolase family 16 protein [Flavobacteriales bacterium]|jgi:beta-glucanase (GH16 family)|tara:strand:- start:293 stop:1168 length:876 start_codon:yes stop_codon:yes gene_type:complete
MQKVISTLFCFLVFFTIGCDEPTAPPILGCTDVAASNFNLLAEQEDGNCLYANSEGLIWSDEFNGGELDLTKWVHETGNGDWGWGNGELQYYQEENTFLSDGTVKIEAREEQRGGFNYTSSRIKTDGLFNFRFGRVQARMKTMDGKAFWPAFWLLPSGGDWPCDGEIDIMEQWGNNGITNETTGAAHLGTCPFSSGQHVYKSFYSPISSGSYADDFHVYEIVWTENKIEWYVDASKVYEVIPSMYPAQYNWPFNSNQWYIILNLAITSAGPSMITEYPTKIEIDWVRVYDN